MIQLPVRANLMRTASILLALVVVMGFVREAGAQGPELVTDCSVVIAGQPFGFITTPADISVHGIEFYTFAYLGPFGVYKVPFTATQGLIGLCVIVFVLIALVATLTLRLKRK